MGIFFLLFFARTHEVGEEGREGKGRDEIPSPLSFVVFFPSLSNKEETGFLSQPCTLSSLFCPPPLCRRYPNNTNFCSSNLQQSIDIDGKEAIHARWLASDIDITVVPLQHPSQA